MIFRAAVPETSVRISQGAVIKYFLRRLRINTQADGQAAISDPKAVSSWREIHRYAFYASRCMNSSAYHFVENIYGRRTQSDGRIDLAQ